MQKYIFITGGVISGLGKGVLSASIGKLFQWRGLKVGMIKCDNYYNCDPGTLNPVEHGEIFVTDDVWNFNLDSNLSFKIAEIDEDFGHYERFLDLTMKPHCNITSGQVFLKVILKERKGGYLGQTIRMIPHIVDEIKRRIKMVATTEKPEILIVEQGGTVGDIEAMPFLEAIRQLTFEVGRKNAALVHLTLVPYIDQLGEYKTKPTQTSVRILQGLGLKPDIIICRADRGLPFMIRSKISMYCNVPVEAVISDPDLENIYELPLILEKQGLGVYMSKILDIPRKNPKTNDWKLLISRFKAVKRTVKIAVVGKYWGIKDSYISIIEALKHSGASLCIKPEIIRVNSEKISVEALINSDGILLTPGFGTRGVEGMIKAASIALRTGKPFLGICFGAQLGIVAYAREVMGWKEANSTEIDPNTPYPVVDLLESQRNIDHLGGSMRLGARSIRVLENTMLRRLYGRNMVKERFRHRYHLNAKFVRKMAGLKISSVDAEAGNITSYETSRRFYIGVQYHPEFKSRPTKPHPIFRGFLKAVTGMRA